MVQSLNLLVNILLGLVAFVFLIADFTYPVDASSYTHYRLPTAIKPNHYHLKIITHLDNPANLTFNGEVLIDLQILENTKNITLHAKNLTIDESRIQLYRSDESEIHSCLEGIDIVPEMDYCIIRLCEDLLKGQIYKVKLHFSSALNEHFLYGYYRTSYTDDGTNETRWLSMTKFEPTYARLAFPCFDEPNYKANFTIWLGHHKNLTGISNMAMETQIPLDGLDDFVWSIFEESVPMPTYLVAYTVNDFVYKEDRVEGSDVVFRTWCRQDIIEECAYAAEAGPKVLAYYERIFGIQFPLKKIDQIAVPAMISPAMENWGLIAYIEMFLQFTPNDSSPPTRSYTDKVISHELAHQWFGNLVTMKWWSDLWLNEGFATYLASFGVNYLHPEYKGYDPEVPDYMFSLFERDAQLDSHPLSRPVCNTSEIRRSFNGISYRKGSAILGMLHRFLGYDEFFEAVRDYLEKHKYSNAEQDDLWAAFKRTAERNNLLDPRYDIKTIMDSWTLQTGFPLVKVNRNHESGSIEITQERFLENATLSSEKGKKCWWIPLTYTTAAEKDFSSKTPKTWLECDEYGKSIPLKIDNATRVGDWIIFNIQISGIYRVTYDRKSWQLIAEALKSENFGNIDVLNRCQLISDVVALAWNGYDNYESVFNILEYLAKEHEYQPWELAYYDLIGVSYILEYFPQTYAYLKAFVGYIIEPEYLRLGGLNDTDATNMTSHQINHKDQIGRWACRVDLKDCVQEAINYFQQWKSSENPKDENPIPESLRSTVYCTAIRHGNTDDWSFLWQRYEESNEYLLDSLACSRNQSVLKDYLHMIFDNVTGMSDDDAMSAFHAIANNKVALSLVREYFAEHANRLCTDFDVDRLIDALHNIFSNDELQKFVNVFDANKECAQKSTQLIPDHLERINLNIKWVERNLKDIKFQLKKRLSAMGIFVEIVEDQK